jgi:hypothetical protein
MYAHCSHSYTKYTNMVCVHIENRKILGFDLEKAAITTIAYRSVYLNELLST